MKLAVSGAAGRMGRRIVALAHEHPGVVVVAALETHESPAIGLDAGELAGIGNIGAVITCDRQSVMEKCDVLVDFSSIAGSLANIKAAADMGKAIVIGTTGFSDVQREELVQYGSKTRCVIAPNMSVGVNLLFKIAGIVAASLGSDYDVEIIEAHHRLKKDSPSGTADRLARIIADALGRDLASSAVYGRQGLVGERKPEEISVLAVRGGDIVGEHTAMFITNGERIELTHRAHSRDALAKGGVRAAVWVMDKPAGVYDMQDVLGLR